MRIRQTISSVVLVFAMTLVIWVVADMRALTVSNELYVPIQVRSPGEQYRVRVVKPANGQMKVRFRGPKRTIDALGAYRDRLVFRYTVTPTQAEQAARGSGEIALAPRQGFEHLTEMRITPESTDPDTVVVGVEPLEKIAGVKVRLAEQDQMQVADDWSATPSEVTAYVPEAALPDIRDTQWHAIPQLQLAVTPLEIGEQRTVTVALEPSIRNLDVFFEPSEVEVTFEPTTEIRTEHVADVRVLVEGPPDIFDRYNVDLERRKVAVTVRGPVTELEAVGSDDIRAVLVLRPDDQPNPDSRKLRPLEIRFPEGSHLQVAGDAPRMNWNLIARPAPEADPRGGP